MTSVGALMREQVALIELAECFTAADVAFDGRRHQHCLHALDNLRLAFAEVSSQPRRMTASAMDASPPSFTALMRFNQLVGSG
jgi:hypothetical protein